MSIVDKLFAGKAPKIMNKKPAAQTKDTAIVEYVYLKKTLSKEIRKKVQALKNKYGDVKEETIYNMLKKCDFDQNCVERELKYLSMLNRDTKRHTYNAYQPLIKSSRHSRGMSNSKIVKNSKIISRSPAKQISRTDAKSFDHSNISKSHRSRKSLTVSKNQSTNIESRLDYKKNEKSFKKCSGENKSSVIKTSKQNSGKFDKNRVKDNNRHKISTGSKRNSNYMGNQHGITSKEDKGLDMRKVLDDIHLSNVPVEQFNNGNHSEAYEIILKQEDACNAGEEDISNYKKHEAKAKLLILAVEATKRKLLNCFHSLKNFSHQKTLSHRQNDKMGKISSEPHKYMTRDKNIKQSLLKDKKSSYKGKGPQTGSRTNKIDVMLKRKLEPRDVKSRSAKEQQLEKKVDDLTSIILSMQRQIDELSKSIKQNGSDSLISSNKHESNKNSMPITNITKNETAVNNLKEKKSCGYEDRGSDN